MRLFNAFKCSDDIDGQRYLVADYNVVCGEIALVAVAVAGHLLYTIGVPGFIFFVLYRNREILHDENHPQHAKVHFELGYLYAQVGYGCALDTGAHTVRRVRACVCV